MSDSSESESATIHRAPPTSKEPEDDEGLRLQNVYSYLAEGKYPLGASKDARNGSYGRNQRSTLLAMGN